MKLTEVILISILITLVTIAVRIVSIEEILKTETFPRQYVTNNTYDITAKNPGSVLIEDCRKED